MKDKDTGLLINMTVEEVQKYEHLKQENIELKAKIDSLLLLQSAIDKNITEIHEAAKSVHEAAKSVHDAATELDCLICL